MKKWKAGAAALVIFVAAVLIFFALNLGNSADVGYSSRGNSSPQESDTGSRDVAGNGGTGEDMTADNGESNTGKGEDISAQKNETESTAAPVKVNKKELIGDRKKPKLKDQRQTHGELSDKQKGQLVRGVVAGKPIVLLACPETKAPGRMQLYKLKPFAFSTQEEKDQMMAMIRKAVTDNPRGYSYSPALLAPDFYVQGNDIWDVTKEQEPYTMQFADPSSYFNLGKYYYDTRIGTTERFYLTQKRAVTKAADFMNQVIDAFSLGCEVAPKTYWDITGESGWYIDQENPYDRDEDFYYMKVVCMEDGYPIFGDLIGSGKGKESNWFAASYSETGWMSMEFNLPHRYVKTGNYETKLLPLSELQKVLLKELKKKAKRGKTYGVGITEAQIGYAAVKKELRPVWMLYGEKKGVGGGRGRYVLDAVTGEILADEFS